jgi:hypothetical protein
MHAFRAWLRMLHPIVRYCQIDLMTVATPLAWQYVECRHTAYGAFNVSYDKLSPLARKVYAIHLASLDDCYAKLHVARKQAVARKRNVTLARKAERNHGA